jgi:hypothetical protein
LYQKKSGNPARFPSCASFFRYWAWKNVAMWKNSVVLGRSLSWTSISCRLDDFLL